MESKMVLVRCCRCSNPVYLPATAKDAQVRCPCCLAEFPATELQLFSPPALELVDQLHPSDAADQRISSGHPSTPEVLGTGLQLANGADVREQAESPATGIIVINESAEPNENDHAASEVVQVRSPDGLHANRRKLARRSQHSFLKTFLGGIAGLTIGQLILWWLPAAHRTDPFELAPKLPAPLAFLAPAELRGDVVPVVSEVAIVPEPQRFVPPTAPSEDQPPTPAVEAHEAASSVVLGLADAPQLAMLELRESLRTANRADKQLGREADWRPETLNTWYRSLCELAYSVTFADMRETTITRFAVDTKTFFTQVGADKKRLNTLSRAAAKRLQSTSGKRDGILIAGNVISISPCGQLFKTKIALVGVPDAKPVDVISRLDPRTNAFGINDNVLIAGVIVSQPSLYLLGYEGQADAVVLGGLPIRVGTSNKQPASLP